MAEVLGPLALLDKALPTGVDGARIAEWLIGGKNGGITYRELAGQLALAIGDANEGLVRKWGWLFYITEEMWMEYEQGGAVTPMPELTDEDRPRARKGSTIGHMVDTHAYGDAVGGTRRYMRQVRPSQIRSAISTIVRSAIWRFEIKLLERFFLNTEYAIGSAGFNVPFVRGTGGTVDYAPPAFEGETFDTTHNHFVGFDSGTLDLDDVFEAGALALQHHGHAPPYQAIVSRADITTIGALPRVIQFVSPTVRVIDRGGATSGAMFFQTGEPEYGHFADYQTGAGLVNLWATGRVPTGFVGMAKSYGQLNAKNPLTVRVMPGLGFGISIVPETLPDDDTPVKQLDVEFEFGVGVGSDRTNGYVAKLVAGGAYGNPTIS
jgi:hypothetical protein